VIKSLLDAPTMAERVAAVARNLLILLLKLDVNLPPRVKAFPVHPDFNDLLNGLRPILRREEAVIRLEEHRRPRSKMREAELVRELTEAEQVIAAMEIRDR
jgi:hypothetical protein